MSKENALTNIPGKGFQSGVPVEEARFKKHDKSKALQEIKKGAENLSQFLNRLVSTYFSVQEQLRIRNAIKQSPDLQGMVVQVLKNVKLGDAKKAELIGALAISKLEHATNTAINKSNTDKHRIPSSSSLDLERQRTHYAEASAGKDTIPRTVELSDAKLAEPKNYIVQTTRFNVNDSVTRFKLGKERRLVDVVNETSNKD